LVLTAPIWLPVVLNAEIPEDSELAMQIKMNERYSRGF
jgi:hypothetical protein